MASISTNLNAAIAQASLKTNARELTASMQQLSTGLRINSAKDDATGISITTMMTTQIRALDQSVRNANDGVALLQTADGATGEISLMLQRMRELAVQSMTDTNTAENRGYLDVEFQQLKQEIVRVADTTEWNGFSVLNGTAGRRVEDAPAMRATANGAFSSAVSYTVANSIMTSANTANPLTTISGANNIAKSGTLKYLGGNSAELILDSGAKINLACSVNGATLSLTDTALSDGSGAVAITATNDWTMGDQLSITRNSPTLSAMSASDVLINGKSIAASQTSSDLVSVSSSLSVLNNAASAIAKVAAFNAATHDTGVSAVAGRTVLSGSPMTGVATEQGVSTGTVTINGVITDPFTTVGGNTRATRAALVDVINKQTASTGVVAVDSGNDFSGIRLEAADGRNIDVAFNTGSTAADFAARTGLRQGVQSGPFSLQAPVNAEVNVQTNGDISRSGLQIGDYTNNESVLSAQARATVTTAGAQVDTLTIANNVNVGDVYKATINGRSVSFTATVATTANVQAGLRAAISADPVLASMVSTQASGSAGITMTAVRPGNGFEVSIRKVTIGSTVTQNVAATATTKQKNTLSITGPVQVGDVFKITISGRSISYTAMSNTVADVRAGLTNALKADPVLGANYNFGVGTSADLNELTVTASSNNQRFAMGMTQTLDGSTVTVTTPNAPALVKPLQAGDLVINGVAIGASAAEDDPFSNVNVTSSSAAASAIAIAAAINRQTDSTGVKATPNTVSSIGSLTDTSGAASGVQSLFINGEEVRVNLISTDTASARQDRVISAINLQSQSTGVVASKNASTSGVVLTSEDGRNLSAWYNSSIAGLSASSFGLSSADVLGLADATQESVGAKTLYASVSLTTVPNDGAPGTERASGLIHVTAGVNGFADDSNFKALGFVEGTYGGQAVGDIAVPKVGRLSFQIGGSSGEEVAIDMVDLGRHGTITGAITGDVDDAEPTVRINTVAGANEVLGLIDAAIEKVSSERAKFGGVMNRLNNAVDNLMNVSANSTSARSQIQDADYAIASTRLARAQIIQQAATAVLAQANISQESVLKLLQ